MSETQVITRFAPSPTGYLHLGHAYSAIFAKNAAEEQGGQFLCCAFDHLFVYYIYSLKQNPKQKLELLLILKLLF